MTFEQAFGRFNHSHSAFIQAKRNSNDVGAIKVAWNDFAHFLLDDGEITKEQFNTWTGNSIS